MNRRLKALLEKRMAFKRLRVPNSVEDPTPGPSSALSTIAAASGSAGVQSSPQQALAKKQLQELVAARARLQLHLDESAASAAAHLECENVKQAAAALAASVATPTAEDDVGVADVEGKKKRKKKRNRKNKKKGDKEAKPEDPENTEKEEDQDEGDSSDVAEKPSARSGPSDDKTAVVAAPSGKPAPKQKAVRDPANPIAYTSDFHYVDSKTGKLIPEKVAKMGYQDRRRIYADFLVPRVMLIHPGLYDDIMDLMYRMPDKHIVQMIYSDYLLGEFASACIRDLQKINYKLKKKGN